MHARDLRWPFLIVIAGVLIASNLAEPTTFGISVEQSSDAYRIAGGTAPWAIGLSAVICCLYLWLMLAPSGQSSIPVPGVMRRWLAFWIDFILAIMATAPILGLIPTLAEWKSTGVFAWSFERTVPQPSDKIVLPVTFVLLAVAMLVFFAFPLYRNRPSPGSCVAGYQVIAVGEVPMTLRTAVLRTLLGIVAAGAPYVAPFLERDRKRGQFWLDKVFATQAIKL